ncbi:MAG: hypothetical protein A3I66_04580 [Burkholderiales bacterium RIFCSPLOWO2_02_FULL_57_36]|nr:MAG: hypothetical protein A3I66_04580 [Burkholderiales bacterium RIFCSPLOWO2_02_FULL_57_36]
MAARILIIEDNQANMELMAYLLDAFGYRVHADFDGAAGIETAQRTLPDLIVCDVHLPEMDGYQIVRHLKGNPALSNIPVIAVTALAMVGDREKLLDAGFDGYIRKPIDPELFAGQIEKFLPVALRAHARFDPAPAMAGVQGSATVRRASILVVDDSPINRELIRSTLEPFGYVLHVADGVQQGWQRARDEAFDLILCDLHMPGEDGFEFIRKIRADSRFDGIPFLFLSATSSSPEETRRALELGASRFLRRPIEPEKLIDELELCLRRHDENEG